MTETFKVQFPQTDIVMCRFSYKTGSSMCKEVNQPAYDALGKKMGCLGTMKTYAYRLPKPLIGNVQVGDMVVVFCQTGYQVCEVVEVNAMCQYDGELAWVVDKVNLEGFHAELERVKELERMKAAIMAEKKRLEAMVAYDLIAEKHPEFGAMLKAFREMGGQL